jgi:hypothetical protein
MLFDDIKSEEEKEMEELTTHERALVFIELAKRKNCFDVHAAHSLLASLQFERVLAAMEKEVSKPNYASVVDDRMQLLNKMLVEISKLEAEKEENKVLQVVDDVTYQMKMKKDYVEKYGEKTANILLNPDSKRRIMNLVERFRAGANGVVSEILNAEEESRK